MTATGEARGVGREGPSDDELLTAVPRQRGGREVRVGIFVLAGLVAILAVLYLATDPALFRGRYHVTTVVADAGGMRQGDPVQMRGVNIGRVSDFSMTDNGVRIRMEIDGKWRIPEDSHTAVTGIGLLGGRVVEIVRGSSSTMVEPGAELPGTTSGDLTQDIQDIGGEARTTLQRIRALLSEPTVTALQGSAQQLDSLLGQLSGFAREQRRQIDRLTASLNRSARGLEAASAAGPDAARAVARADSLLSRLNQTGTTLDRAATSLDSVLEGLNRGEGTIGQLARNDSLYQNLNRAAESLYLLTTDLREHPGRYLKISLF